VSTPANHSAPAKRLPVLTIIAITLLSIEMWVLGIAFAVGFVAMLEVPL
jgi:hypothetical protein